MSDTAPAVADLRRKYITVSDAADALGVSKRTLDRWESQRVGPPRTKIGRTSLYRAEALEAWMRDRETSPVRTLAQRTRRGQ
jgi:excisionase family DNA binding protein